MRGINKKIFLLLLLALPIIVWAQTDIQSIIRERIERLKQSDEESNIDYDAITQLFYFYHKHPINLNNTTKEKLKSLNLLTDIQINNLFLHIQKNGKLLRLEELQSIKGFSLQSIYLILPFVKINNPTEKPRIRLKNLKNGKNKIIVQHQNILEKKKGFKNGKYLGSPFKLRTAYSYDYYRVLRAGISTEKDAGESNLTDFYSAYVFLENQGKFKQLAIGDYHIQLGQGLSIWSGFSFGKSTEITLIKKNPIGIKPHTSSNESTFLRGFASCYQFGKFSSTFFYSRKKIDASLTDIDNQQYMTSINTTGYHRTSTELENKNSSIQQIIGGSINFDIKNVSISAILVNNKLGHDFAEKEALYQKYYNQQAMFTNVGIAYNTVIKNVNFFGEISNTLSHGNAFLNGILVALSQKISISILHRNYSNTFKSIFHNGFSENTRNQSEEGIFSALSYDIFKHIRISAYYDKRSYKWLRYGTDNPSNSNEYSIEIKYKPSKKLSCYFRLSSEYKTVSEKTDITRIAIPQLQETNKYLFNYDYRINKKITLKGRVVLSDFKSATNIEDGFLMYQDITYNSFSSKIDFSFRYVLMDAKDYNTRIYAYEKDIVNGGIIPAYYREGTRIYLIIKYKIANGIKLSAKYGLWHYDNINTIGSGLEEINGNKKSEVNILLSWKF